MKVRDVMSSPAITVAAGTPYGEVVHCLLTHNISGVPVVDASGRLVGIVSETDLVLKHAGEHLTATELMTADPITASLDEELADVARRMLAKSVNRLPVMRGDELVGLISRHDLLRSFVRPDHAIQADITALLADRSRVPPNAASSSVLMAAVTLTGTVSCAEDRAAIEALVGAIDGVVSLDNQLVAQA